MDMHEKQTRNNKNKPKTIMQMEQEVKDAINVRIHEWTEKKKELIHLNNPVNKNSMNIKIMDIMPWTIWWFNAGENIGREAGAHVNANDTFFFNRPCIVVSKLKTQHDSDHTLVTILPMSSKSEGISLDKTFIHKLNKEDYPRKGKYKGLNKDSYVVCHQIKTIDTKRLMNMVTKRIEQDDIDEIRNKLRMYLDIEETTKID